jgi:hypothetical protein
MNPNMFDFRYLYSISNYRRGGRGYPLLGPRKALCAQQRESVERARDGCAETERTTCGWCWRTIGLVTTLSLRYSMANDNPQLVMRKEAVHTLILNVPLFKGMLITIAQDPRYLRFSTIEDGSAVHYNLRVCDTVRSTLNLFSNKKNYTGIERKGCARITRRDHEEHSKSVT